MCPVCTIDIDTNKDDYTVLNGSCRHVMHAQCRDTRVLYGGHACPSCPQKHVDVSDPMFTDAANVTSTATPAAAAADSGGFLAPLASLVNSLARRLDADVEKTPMAMLRAHKPLAYLQRAGITAQTVIDAHTTTDCLFEQIVSETAYTPAQLVGIGFRWPELIACGMNEKNFPGAYAKYGSAFIETYVTDYRQLLDLCSRAPALLPDLGIKAEDWASILGGKNAAAERLLSEVGVRPRNLYAFGFTMGEWQETLGMKREMLLRFSRADLMAFVGHDEETADECEQRFSLPPILQHDGLDRGSRDRGRPAAPRGLVRARGGPPRGAHRHGPPHARGAMRLVPAGIGFDEATLDL